MQKPHNHLRPKSLIPQRFNIIDLLHSLRSQYKRMLLLYTNTIFDTDAHAAEMGRVSFRVGDVEAASTEMHQRRVKDADSGGGSLRLDSDTLPWLQLCLSGLAWSIVDV